MFSGSVGSERMDERTYLYSSRREKVLGSSVL